MMVGVGVGGGDLGSEFTSAGFSLLLIWIEPHKMDVWPIRPTN